MCAAWFATQAAIATGLGIILDDVPGTTWTEVLFVGNSEESKAAFNSIAEPVEISEGEDGGSKAAFHIANTASINTTILHHAFPWVVVPCLVLTNW
jgi:hypothetical protein